MAKAVAIFTGGVSELRQIAISEAGQAYSRAQINHPVYGRSWSKWTATGEKFGQNAIMAIDEIEIGFAKLRRATPSDCYINNRALFDDKGNIKVRLP